MTTIKTLRFGCEIETVRLQRERVVRAIQTVVGGTVRYAGTSYDTWECVAADGRVWKAMADASLGDRLNSAEIVSPILQYSDIETLQEVVRAVRRAGARVSQSCGIHVHVSVERFDGAAVARLVKSWARNEELFMHALGVTQNRRERFCKEVEGAFMQRLERDKPRTTEELNRAWYGYLNLHPQRYCPTRYRALNLAPAWRQNTCEFRLFEASLHAGKVKAHVQFALALAARALDSKSASSKRRPLNRATAKYDLRVVLLALGLVGDEFKTCRHHLLSGLEGSAAWKHGRPARAQAEAA